MGQITMCNVTGVIGNNKPNWLHSHWSGFLAWNFTILLDLSALIGIVFYSEKKQTKKTLLKPINATSTALDSRMTKQVEDWWNWSDVNLLQ